MAEPNSKSEIEFTADEIEAVTAIEFAVVLREKRFTDGRLRACDARRQRLLTQCIYHKNGKCTIDFNSPCRGKCTDDDKYIVNFGLIDARIKKRK